MADPCSECRESPAATTTVTGRPVCQRCANRLQGAAAGTILGGPEQGIATGVAAENLTGLATAFPPAKAEGSFWQRWKLETTSPERSDEIHLSGVAIFESQWRE